MSDKDFLSGRDDGQGAPSRFVEVAGRPGGPDSLERRAGAMLRDIKPPATLSAAGLARVRMRLDQSIRPTSTSARLRWAPVARWVMVGALMLFGSGVVAAARGWAPSWPILWTLLPHTSSPSSEAPAPRREIRRLTPAAAPVPVSPPVTSPAAEPQPTLAPTVSPPPITTTASPHRRSTAVAERALLERAVMALRQKRDPNKALALLDDYEVRFSTRVLAPEAARLRIEALILAGRRQRALEELNRLVLSEGARDLELGLMRGVLRAAAGDCARAVVDFDRVRSSASDGSMKRRAEAGRATCLGVGSPRTAGSDGL